MAGVARGALPAFPRPRRIAFPPSRNAARAFEALLTWDDGRPDTVLAFERVGKAYLAFAE